MSLWRRVLSERRRVVVPVLTVLVINVAVLALAVFPLERSVAADERSATDVAFALADARRQERVANNTRASKLRADEELKKFYAEVLPKSLSEARGLLYLELSKIGVETGLATDNSSYEPEEVKDSSLMRFRVDVVLNGEYPNIHKFLYRLETAEEFFVVESVKLGQSGRIQGGSGSIEVVLQVATYYTVGAK